MSLFNIFNIASAALTAQSKKIEIGAYNLSNMDTYIYDEKKKKYNPFIAKKVRFQLNHSNTNKKDLIKVVEYEDKKKPYNIVYDPSNALANKEGYVKKSNVDVFEEIINNITASRNYQADIEILNTVKYLISKTITIGQ